MTEGPSESLLRARARKVARETAQEKSRAEEAGSPERYEAEIWQLRERLHEAEEARSKAWRALEQAQREARTLRASLDEKLDESARFARFRLEYERPEGEARLYGGRDTIRTRALRYLRVNGPTKTQTVVDALGGNRPAIANALTKLREAGEVHQPARAVWVYGPAPDVVGDGGA